MLKALRKKEVAKRILYVLAAVIIPAFVLWGSGSLIRNRQSANFAGKIFGKRISLEEYRDSLFACKNQAIMQFGENFYKLQGFLNLEKEAWDRLILLYEAKRRRITISNSEVVNKIKEIAFLQTNGQFDPKLYQNILDYLFKTPARDFEEQIRQSLMFQKLYEQVANQEAINDQELLESYKKENEKIKIGYISFLVKDLQDKVVLEDKELKDYFDNHASDFSKPPSVNIQYIGFDYPKEALEEDKKLLREKISEVYLRLSKEKDLAKVSKDYALAIKETGFFSMEDPVPGMGLSFEFLQAAFSLKDNQISQSVETAKGIYILKLKEKKGSYIPAFEEAKPAVEKMLKRQKAAELAGNKAKEVFAKLEEIYKNTPGAFDFKKAAEGESLNYAQTPVFKYGQYIQDIGASEEFSKEAFSLKDKNRILGFVSTPQGSYILKLEEFVPSDENKFSEEKEKFRDSLSQKKKDEAFNKFFLELKIKAQLVNNISAMKPR